MMCPLQAVRNEIDDSHNLSRVTEVAYEFSVRRWDPSDLYTKTAPATLRIFDTFRETTFVTLSALFRPRAMSDLSGHTDGVGLV